MDILIVESNADLAAVWSAHLRRLGAVVLHVADHEAAVLALEAHRFDLVLMNVNLRGEGALAVADFAAFRWPDLPVLFVSATSFFSDGSIFRFLPNACGLINATTPPDDIAALVEFHASRSERAVSGR